MKKSRLYLATSALALCAAFPWVAEALPYTSASLLGVYTTDNVPSLTIGWVDQFGNANGGQITLNGATSGSSTIAPPATAGTGVFTLPAGATDTLVSRTSTDTLSNKTISSAVFLGPVAAACGATCSLNAGHAGGTYLLNQASGSTATLPSATGTGNTYKMIITVATTSAAEKILTSPTTDTIIGTAIGENAGTAKIFVGNASTYHSIQMPFAGTQPSGGFIGDTVSCTDIATATWICNINYQAGTTPTTPYSASTS